MLSSVVAQLRFISTTYSLKLFWLCPGSVCDYEGDIVDDDSRASDDTEDRRTVLNPDADTVISCE